jgi:hypothetical protein
VEVPVISVLLASRGRPESLRRSIRGLLDTADQRDEVQVLVACDPDDPATYDAAVALPNPSGVNYTWIAPERYGYSRLYEYYNALAEHASGEWLLNWNDDAFMTTTGWDLQITDLPPEVLVADLHNSFSPGLCCFPAVRWEAVAALGAFCIDTPHIDSWWQEISRRSGTIRAIPAHVHHDRADLTGGHDDATYREGREGLRNEEFYGPRTQSQIDAAVVKVTAACL